MINVSDIDEDFGSGGGQKVVAGRWCWCWLVVGKYRVVMADKWVGFWAWGIALAWGVGFRD